MDVLQLDVSGRPQAWLTPKEAATLYVLDHVAWTLGKPCMVMRGGTQRRTGLPSRLSLHPIIAVHGAMPARTWSQTPALSNPKLFQRDRQICAYCGGRFPWTALTREHIVPTSRRGVDSWSNCITTCKNCNGRKGNRTLDEMGWQLYYLPYTPSLYEDMILRGRRILADQMEFLLASVPANSRLRN